MTEHDIECRIRLSCKDFVMANHLVHGVSVLPGVAFLDIVYRVLAAQGIDPRDTALRNVLFAEPVTTRDGFDRELRVRVTTEDGIRRVRVDSRWLRDGQPCAPWRDNARGELVPADRLPAAPLDVDRLKAGATATDDLDVLYARTRREGIRHGDAMTCVGRLYRGDPYLLAELRLAPGANGHEDGFHLHPAKMDAATLVAFGQDESVGAEPFIPFHIGYVHAPRPLTAAVYVHVPRPETPAASGDLLRNDYTLHDEGGRLLAEFRDMSCKRIRRPELITRLLSEVDSPAVDPVDDVVRYLRQRVAAALGTTPDEVATDVGFYDLGLDSVALLRLGEELETLVGTGLYPTLLFEYGDIGSLARHLAATYEIRPDATGAPADGVPADPVPVAPAPAVPGVPWCQREVWVKVPAVPAASPVPSGPLVVFGGEADLGGRLRTRAGRV